MLDAAAELRLSIQRACADVHADGRVAEALYGVAIDLLGPRFHQDLSPLQRARLLRALDVPVGKVARQAVEALELELAAFLSDESPASMPAIDVSGWVATGRVSRLDFE